jgi:hypothetical protein
LENDNTAENQHALFGGADKSLTIFGTLNMAIFQLGKVHTIKL